METVWKLFTYTIHLTCPALYIVLRSIEPFLKVIDLHTQLSYFESARETLRQKLGVEEANALLSRAVHLFSVGSNDYVFPFETNSSTLRSYSPEEFVGVVIGNITAVIKVSS